MEIHEILQFIEILSTCNNSMEFNLESNIPYIIGAFYIFLFQFHEPLNH
jgi:hypothetical protein